MPKIGDFITCPECDGCAIWVYRGYPIEYLYSCDKCGGEFDEKGNGKRILLCKNKCHIPLHIIMASLIWKHITKEDRPKVIESIIRFTEHSWKNNIHKKDLGEVQSCLKTFMEMGMDTFIDNDKGIKKCIRCEMELDIEDEWCEHCCAFQQKDASME